MTGGEDEPEKIVAHGIVDRRVEIRLRARELLLEITRDLVLLAVVQRSATKGIDGAMLCGAHEPGGRVVRHTRLRPALQGRDQCILSEVFGKTDVANDARETRDQ